MSCNVTNGKNGGNNTPEWCFSASVPKYCNPHLPFLFHLVLVNPIRVAVMIIITCVRKFRDCNTSVRSANVSIATTAEELMYRTRAAIFKQLERD